MSCRVTDTLISAATTANADDLIGAVVGNDAVESITFNGYQTCEDYEPSYTDDISLDKDDISLTTQLSEWFKDLQEKCNFQSDDIRVFLSFIEHKGHVHGNHTEKSKLAQVRTAFSNFLAEKGGEITTIEIETFLSNNAFFYLQLPWNDEMYNKAKGDGLCLYRSLYQLYNLYNCNIDKKQRHYTQMKRIITADVDLTNIISRDEFVLFLQRIFEGLQKMTLNSKCHQGGDFCDPRLYGDGSQIEKYINKLERILEFINQYGLEADPDWRKFTLDVSLWGDFELVKLIPYLFSKVTAFDGIHEFTGSYFAANSDARTKFFGEVEDNDKFAFLISSMEHRTNIVSYIEPQSLKLKYLKQVLEEPKMVFWSHHFFPILSERNEDYEKLLSKSISEISNQISKFITSKPIPMQSKVFFREPLQRDVEAILEQVNCLKDELKKRGFKWKNESSMEIELRDAKAKAAKLKLKNAELEKELQRYRNTTAV